jgi:hypothetical protein
MLDVNDPRLTPIEAGRLFPKPITAAAVRRYDIYLTPERTPSGRRLYRRSVVLAFVREHYRGADTTTTQAAPAV